MKFFFLLFALVASVQAGGLQGCMERILAFQAYEIDALNDPADRSVGFKCSHYDKAAGRCLGNWVPCRGSAPGNRCNYDEFIRSLGRAPFSRDWGVHQPGTNRLDIETTAMRCYRRYVNQGAGNRPVPNFKSYHVLRGERGEFNAYVKRLGQVIDETYRNKRTAANAYMFQDADLTRDRIIVLRAADHGANAIPAARNYLGPDMEVRIQDLGHHPLQPGARLEVVDYKATALAARAAGIDNYRSKIRDFLTEFYAATVAREHLTVNRSYRKVADRARSCRG